MLLDRLSVKKVCGPLHRMVFDRRPILIQLQDKCAARDYVREKIGERVLARLYWLTKTPADITRGQSIRTRAGQNSCLMGGTTTSVGYGICRLVESERAVEKMKMPSRARRRTSSERVSIETALIATSATGRGGRT
jgi:hypothetical protein